MTHNYIDLIIKMTELTDVIIITRNNIYKNKMDMNEIYSEYEGYCPIFKYNIVMCVKNGSGYRREYMNNIASQIYNAEMYGDVIIAMDEDDVCDIDKVFNYIKDRYL